MYEEPSAEKPIKQRGVSRAAHTVVLGGGTGGLVAAHELRRRLPNSDRVVLVDRSPEHVYQPSLLWQIVGQRHQDQFRRPLNRLERKGIEFRNDEVEEIDLESKVVRTGSSWFLAAETSATRTDGKPDQPRAQDWSALRRAVAVPAFCDTG